MLQLGHGLRNDLVGTFKGTCRMVSVQGNMGSSRLLLNDAGCVVGPGQGCMPKINAGYTAISLARTRQALHRRLSA